MAIGRTKFVKYAVLPGVIPRLRGLIGSGFAFLASLIAVIYSNVGLLPAGHKYLDPNNVGGYGIRHVVAEAGNNLVFSRKHIDQIIIYFTILIGISLLVLQIVLLGVSLLSTPVMASTWYNMFSYTNAVHMPGGKPSQDLAFIVLENIFGVKAMSGTGSILGFYNTCISDMGVNCEDIRGNIIATPGVFPFPIHFALHKLLHFYTLGIAFLAGLVIIYFVIAIIGETVTTGTPFGQRLNKAWFIPRLIAFFALIAPISIVGNNAGINVAQLIVFSVAKFGSNMATNAWVTFNDEALAAMPIPAANSLESLGQNRQLLATPNPPELGGLTQFMHVARTCMYAEKIVNGIDVRPYLVRSHDDDTASMNLHTGATEPRNAMGGTTDDYLDYRIAGLGLSDGFKKALIFSRYNTIVLRFGHHNPPGGVLNDLNDPPGSYEGEWGHVQPTCGEIHLQITSLDKHVIGNASIWGFQEIYFNRIAHYVDYFDYNHDPSAYCMVNALLPYNNDPTCLGNSFTIGGPFGYSENTEWITTNSAKAGVEYFNSTIKRLFLDDTTDWGTSVNGGAGMVEDFKGNLTDPAYVNNLLMPTEIKERGWAAAALWYNKIAEMNGLLISATNNLPNVFKYPMVMEQIATQHKENDTTPSYNNRFSPRLQNDQLVTLPRPGDQYIATLLYNDFNFWATSKVQQTVHTKEYNNAILDYVNTIFGTQGLVDIMENKGTHPLAMLSATGKAMVDASIRNLFSGIVGQGIGSMLGDSFLGKTAQAASGFIIQFSLITLSIGFMLYYVLPFMPFIYFFFAFSGWIKSIFEAVVAMPLWALAHIKIDGEGLPGPWATNGYFLIFEIFLRPTLIIFGLLASIALFSALVDTFHDVFHIVTLTATGYDIEREMFEGTILMSDGTNSMNYWRSPLDELFYTAIYTIVVYMLALSCFKLIDQIPNNIMRWMGVTVSTFQENAGDPAGELTGKMYRATQMANAQMTQMIARMKGGTSSAVGDNAVIMGSTGG